ncbi:MAG: hypothetical protein PHT31_05245 [Candidatus Omnitrophica bacterium]|nr:hypothetical protein [Candidatus Omnitrophota bacterium]
MKRTEKSIAGYVVLVLFFSFVLAGMAFASDMGDEGGPGVHFDVLSGAYVPAPR